MGQRNKDLLSNCWVTPDNDNEYSFYRHIDHGTDALLTVTKINNSWRWEVYKKEIMIDMDGWWGICKSKEEAQTAALKNVGVI